MKDLLVNSHSRLFKLRQDEAPLYLGKASIFRVQYVIDVPIGRRATLLLKEPLSPNSELPKLENRDALVVTYSDHGNPSIFQDSNILAVFKNCMKHRSWIPHMIAANTEEMDAIYYWLELYSYDYYDFFFEKRWINNDI